MMRRRHERSAGSRDAVLPDADADRRKAFVRCFNSLADLLETAQQER